MAGVLPGGALADTIMRVMMMDRCQAHLASTDYTIQISVSGLCAFLGSRLGGIPAGRVGAGILFLLIPPLMLSFLAAVPRLLLASEFEPMHRPWRGAP